MTDCVTELAKGTEKEQFEKEFIERNEIIKLIGDLK